MGALTDTRTTIMAVVKQIQEDFTAYQLDVESDNRTTINQGKQSKPYLRVEVEPLSGEQASLGANPLVEQRGQILLYACAKEGSGALLADQLRDFITPYFDRKVLGFVQCHTAFAVMPKAVQGWVYYPLIIDYYYHRVAS